VHAISSDQSIHICIALHVVSESEAHDEGNKAECLQSL